MEWIKYNFIVYVRLYYKNVLSQAPFTIGLDLRGGRGEWIQYFNVDLTYDLRLGTQSFRIRNFGVKI